MPVGAMNYQSLGLPGSVKSFGAPRSNVSYARPSPQSTYVRTAEPIPYACTREGGRIRFPDGAVLHPGAALVRPDGRTVYPAPDGSIEVDALRTLLLPDMSLLFEDGSRIFPDGRIDQSNVASGAPGMISPVLQRQGMFDVPTGATKFSDGTFKFPNGVTCFPDGSMRLPEGSIVLPNGQLVYPDGTHALELLDGSYRLTDGTLFLPDGSLRFRDGTVQRSDGAYEEAPGIVRRPNPNEGAILLPNGLVQMMDGSVHLPDGSVQLTDGQLMQPDGTLAPRLPDGSYELWDGTKLLADGRIRRHKDNSLLLPDGSEIDALGKAVRGPRRPQGLLPDGTRPIPEGSEPLDDGAWRFPNGLVWMKDGTIQLPDGNLRLPDDRLQRLDNTTALPDVHGNFLLEDGSLLMHDNSLRAPDGTLRRPDGSIVHPDGTEQLPDGSLRYKDGMMRLANGNIVHPDYSIQFPNGQIRLPNGAARGAHGLGPVETSHTPAPTDDPHGQLPAVDWIRLPDGSMRLANGMMQYPDGSVKLPEGSIRLPDGRLQLPNHTFSPKLADGTYRLSDGSLLRPDGVIQYTDGTMRQLDGSLRLRDGSVVAMDGTAYPPGWPAPRLLSPLFSTPKPPLGAEMAPDGSYVLPNGMRQRPDGSVLLPEGSHRSATGDITYPDGRPAEVAYDGSHVLTDGSLLKADGTLQYRDGSLLYPDGSVAQPNGEVHLRDGRVLPPGAVVPRHLIPGFKRNVGCLPPGQMPELPRGALKLRDGTYKLPNQMIYHPDGRLTLPDGSVKHPDGRVRLPTGQWVLPGLDGTTYLSDGTALRPDGSLVGPGGAVRHPDGTVTGGPGSPSPGSPSGPQGIAQPYAAPAVVPAGNVAPKKEKRPAKERLQKLFHRRQKTPAPGPTPDAAPSASPAATPSAGGAQYPNGIRLEKDGKTHVLPDGSRVDDKFRVTRPDGLPIQPNPQGEWELMDGTRLTRNLGIKYRNNVTQEKDGAVTCPDGSVRLPPPQDTQLQNAATRAVVTAPDRVFPLSDGTQLLPNLGIRGIDKMITTVTGSRERPTLGGQLQWTTNERGTDDAVVVNVLQGGALERAGVRNGDVLETWNDVPLTQKEVLQSRLDQTYPGEVVQIRVRRDGRPVGAMRVVVGSSAPSAAAVNAELPAAGAVHSNYAFPPPQDGAARGGPRAWFGARVQYVADPAAGRGDTLVQVYDVEENSPALKAGFQPEDLIRTWDGTPVEGEAAWRRLMQASAPGQRVVVGATRGGRPLELTVLLEGTTREPGSSHRVQP